MTYREVQVGQEVLEAHVLTPLEDPATVEIAITDYNIHGKNKFVCDSLNCRA
jgi:hypothetical protein